MRHLTYSNVVTNVRLLSIFSFLYIISTSNLFSQEWTLVPVLTDVGTDVGVQFIESDKGSNNLVLGNAARIYHMSATGAYKQFDNDDFFLNSSFPEVKILNNKITCIRQGDGVYEINSSNDVVTELYSGSFDNLFLEEDTTWVFEVSNFSGYRFYESSNNTFSFNGDKFEKMGGHMFAAVDSGILRYNYDDSYTWFKESTSSIISNNTNDLSANDVLNHLYVATANGISVFNGTSFQVHYIPALFPEMEYENVRKVLWDDKNNMLWMVLADENDVIKKISGTNGTWMHFDNSNAPFAMEDFNDMAVDSLGNIWIASDGDVHVLGLDSLKGWLGVEELETEKINFSIHPNPSAENFYLTSSETGIYNISVYDVNGRILFTKGDVYFKSGDELIIESKDWLKGAYFIEMKSSDGNLRTKKVIKW